MDAGDVKTSGMVDCKSLPCFFQQCSLVPGGDVAYGANFELPGDRVKKCNFVHVEQIHAQCHVGVVR